MSCGVDGETTYHENIEHYDFRTDTWTLLEDPPVSSTAQQTMTSDEVKQVWEMVTGQSSSHNAGGAASGSNHILTLQQQAALLAGMDEAAFFENNDNGENEEEDPDQDQGSLQFEEFSVKSYDDDDEEAGDQDGGGAHSASSSDGFVTMRKSFLGRSCHTMMRIL